MKIPYLIPGLIFTFLISIAMFILIRVSQGAIAQYWYNIATTLICIGIGLMWYCSIKVWSSKYKKYKEHKNHKRHSKN